MKSLIERGYWWIARRLYGVTDVGGIDFIFIESLSGKSASQIRAVLADAMRLISQARGGVGELVASHLRLVASLGVRSPYASHVVRAYISGFKGHEAANSQYLACQLVWAATSIRLSRDSLAHGRKLDRDAIHSAALDAQIRFVRLLPGGEDWATYLLENSRRAP